MSGYIDRIKTIVNSTNEVYYNLGYNNLRIMEEKNNEGTISSNDVLMINTGRCKGRSPNDKYFVKQDPSQKHISWGNINRVMEPWVFEELFEKCTEFIKGNTLYVFVGYCGASLSSRIKVRFITTHAWQHHFVKNMFIEMNDYGEVDVEKCGGDVDFTIINANDFENEDYKRHGLYSKAFVTMNIEEKVGLIGGTSYGGEMKKAIFSLMNYLLPQRGIMTMHCSANKHKDTGDVAIFFGLSGTGKTTLSTDPNRLLIGDDEHGWDDNGVFNLEGGCFAKTIDLSKEKEPDIYNAIRRNAIMENVYLDENCVPDYYNKSLTQNGRVSYPLTHIDNRALDSMGGQPSVVILLTCDAFGVLPPVARLTAEQAMYYFLSGYTAKVAGTEQGVKEPIATFSACFGEAFMPLHPTKYAEILEKKLKKHNVRTYLINTGWSGGAYGIGKRMAIPVTRSCVNAVLDGSIENTTYVKDSNFGFELPTSISNVESSILNPENTWSDKNLYQETVDKLIGMFKDNYGKIPNRKC